MIICICVTDSQMQIRQIQFSQVPVLLKGRLAKLKGGRLPH